MNSDKLSDTDVLRLGVVEDLKVALEQLRQIRPGSGMTFAVYRKPANLRHH